MIVEFDIDQATYVGDGERGCYYQVGSGTDNYFYYTVVVSDGETGWDEEIDEDVGPYLQRFWAVRLAQSAAEAWCTDNGVVPNPDADPR